MDPSSTELDSKLDLAEIDTKDSGQPSLGASQELRPDISVSSPPGTPKPRAARRDQDSRDVSKKKATRPRPHHYPLSVASGPDFILINDNRRSDPPVVIQKQNGRPGTFVPYSKETHSQLNLPGDFNFSQTPTGNLDPHNVWIPTIAILGIITLSQCSYLIVITGKENVGKIEGKLIYHLTETRFISFKSTGQNVSNEEYSAPFQYIKEWIDSEVFHFSFKYDLTHTLQYQYLNQSDVQGKPLWQLADRRFFWNHHLCRHFIRQRLDHLIVPVIRGFAKVTGPLKLDNQGKVELQIGLISRISCMRAGTRYNTRGINDDGNVANFVETEQIIFMEERVCSFLQLRGSVPVFWEQRTKGVVGNVVPTNLTRTAQATQHSFAKHFDELLTHYGKITPVNLLSLKKDGESTISNAYQDQIGTYNVPPGAIHYIQWDMHHHCGQTNYQNIVKIMPLLQPDIEIYRFFSRDSKEILERQSGAFRINCMDCLDRTNVIQNLAAQMSFVLQLQSVLGDRITSGSIPVPLKRTSQVGAAINGIWADNGDALSKAYTGTGAIKSDYTRTGGKKTLGGMFDDVSKSLTRLYINNFKDGEKQEAIDLFLGNIEEEIAEVDQSQTDRWVAAQLRHHSEIFTTTTTARILIGTWSVHGSRPGANATLDGWISPDYPNLKDVDHDSVTIYIFGFQALGDESEADIEHWDSALKNQINLKRKQKVILAGFSQINGIAVLVFVDEVEMKNVRRFSIQKDSLSISGATNFVAVRFDYYNSAICCVCCLLSEGPNELTSRVTEINQITAGTHFDEIHHTPSIQDHDYQFWFGNLNFTIDLPFNEVTARIQNNDLDILYNNDQLTKARKAGTLWKNHEEMKVKFRPTYKFAIGTDLYENQEKTIAPAWTDRILYYSDKETQHSIEPLVYTHGKLYASDHRPVKGLFDLVIKHIDQELKTQLDRFLLTIAQKMNPQELSNLIDKVILKDWQPVTSPRVPKSKPLVPLSPMVQRKEACPTPPKEGETKQEEAEYTNTQKTILEYYLSLTAINDKLQSSFPSAEITMAASNLVAGTVKALLVMLSNFENNAHAKALTEHLIQLVVMLGVKAKLSAANPSSLEYHDDLVGIIADMAVTINLFIPKIV